jgi:hypothetical protein
MVVAEVAGRDEQKWQVSCNGSGKPCTGERGDGRSTLEEWF